MQSIHQHAGIRGADVGKQCHSLCQRADMRIRNEFEHHAYSPEAGCRTGTGQISREPSTIGIIAHHNYIPCAYLNGGIESGFERRDIAFSCEPDRLDIEHPDTCLRETPLDTADQIPIAYHRENVIGWKRWHDTQSNCIVSSRLRGPDQRDRICFGVRQCGDEEAPLS
jgi:hypothetical protein